MPKPVKYLLIPGLLCIVVVAIVYAANLGSGGGTPESQVIVELRPGPGDSTLRQSQVGIVLLTGWNAELTLNGVAIPPDQVDRNLELGEVFFQPGEGKAVTTLAAGNNCVSANYWQLATGEDVSFTRSWCFTAN